MSLPQASNQRGNLDFVSDTLASARIAKLAVVDHFKRECLFL